MGYRAVWWRLFHAPNAEEWFNCLTLVRLLLTLPVSNGKLERVFSTLKVLKVDKRSLIGNDTLDDLLVLNTDRIPLKEFDPDRSIKLWWNSKKRRVNQGPRKEHQRKYRDQECDNSSSDDSQSLLIDSQSLESLNSEVGNSVLLDDWDEFTLTFHH